MPLPLLLRYASTLIFGFSIFLLFSLILRKHIRTSHHIPFHSIELKVKGQHQFKSSFLLPLVTLLLNLNSIYLSFSRFLSDKCSFSCRHDEKQNRAHSYIMVSMLKLIHLLFYNHYHGNDTNKIHAIDDHPSFLSSLLCRNDDTNFYPIPTSFKLNAFQYIAKFSYFLFQFHLLLCFSVKTWMRKCYHLF